MSVLSKLAHTAKSLVRVILDYLQWTGKKLYEFYKENFAPTTPINPNDYGLFKSMKDLADIKILDYRSYDAETNFHIKEILDALSEDIAKTLAEEAVESAQQEMFEILSCIKSRILEVSAQPTESKDTLPASVVSKRTNSQQKETELNRCILNAAKRKDALLIKLSNISSGGFDNASSVQNTSSFILDSIYGTSSTLQLESIFQSSNVTKETSWDKSDAIGSSSCDGPIIQINTPAAPSLTCDSIRFEEETAKEWIEEDYTSVITPLEPLDLEPLKVLEQAPVQNEEKEISAGLDSLESIKAEKKVNESMFFSLQEYKQESRRVESLKEAQKSGDEEEAQENIRKARCVQSEETMGLLALKEFERKSAALETVRRTEHAAVMQLNEQKSEARLVLMEAAHAIEEVNEVLHSMARLEYERVAQEESIVIANLDHAKTSNHRLSSELDSLESDISILTKDSNDLKSEVFLECETAEFLETEIARLEESIQAAEALVEYELFMEQQKQARFELHISDMIAVHKTEERINKKHLALSKVQELVCRYIQFDVDLCSTEIDSLEVLHKKIVESRLAADNEKQRQAFLQKMQASFLVQKRIENKRGLIFWERALKRAKKIPVIKVLKLEKAVEEDMVIMEDASESDAVMIKDASESEKNDDTQGFSFVELLQFKNSNLQINTRNNGLVPLLPNVNICKQTTDSYSAEDDIPMTDMLVENDMTPCLNKDMDQAMEVDSIVMSISEITPGSLSIINDLVFDRKSKFARNSNSRCAKLKRMTTKAHITSIHSERNSIVDKEKCPSASTKNLNSVIASMGNFEVFQKENIAKSHEAYKAEYLILSNLILLEVQQIKMTFDYKTSKVIITTTKKENIVDSTASVPSLDFNSPSNTIKAGKILSKLLDTEIKALKDYQVLFNIDLFDDGMPNLSRFKSKVKKEYVRLEQSIERFKLKIQQNRNLQSIHAPLVPGRKILERKKFVAAQRSSQSLFNESDKVLAEVNAEISESDKSIEESSEECSNDESSTEESSEDDMASVENVGENYLVSTDDEDLDYVDSNEGWSSLSENGCFDDNEESKCKGIEVCLGINGGLGDATVTLIESNVSESKVSMLDVDMTDENVGYDGKEIRIEDESKSESGNDGDEESDVVCGRFQFRVAGLKRNFHIRTVKVTKSTQSRYG